MLKLVEPKVKNGLTGKIIICYFSPFEVMIWYVRTIETIAENPLRCQVL